MTHRIDHKVTSTNVWDHNAILVPCIDVGVDVVGFYRDHIRRTLFYQGVDRNAK